MRYLGVLQPQVVVGDRAARLVDRELVAEQRGIAQLLHERHPELIEAAQQRRYVSRWLSTAAGSGAREAGSASCAPEGRGAADGPPACSYIAAKLVYKLVAYACGGQQVS